MQNGFLKNLYLKWPYTDSPWYLHPSNTYYSASPLRSAAAAAAASQRSLPYGSVAGAAKRSRIDSGCQMFYNFFLIILLYCPCSLKTPLFLLLSTSQLFGLLLLFITLNFSLSWFVSKHKIFPVIKFISKHILLSFYQESRQKS